MKNKIIISVLVAFAFVLGTWFGPRAVKAFGPQYLEVNKWQRIYVPEETDLALALREAANNNNRTGWVHVSFETGDYTGGNDSALFVNLIMVEPHEEPFE